MNDINELRAKLEEERDHSAFLGKLLRVLYGDGWNNLTISDARNLIVIPSSNKSLGLITKKHSESAQR